VDLWRWVDTRRIVILSSRKVLLWTLGDAAPEEPVVLLEVLDGVTPAKIDLEFDNNGRPTYVLLSGRRQQGKTQLHSVEKRGSQLIDTPLSTLGKLADGQTLLLCFATGSGPDSTASIFPVTKGPEAAALQPKKIKLPFVRPGSDCVAVSFLPGRQALTLFLTTGEVILVDALTGTLLCHAQPGQGHSHLFTELKLALGADGNGFVMLDDSLKVSALDFVEASTEVQGLQDRFATFSTAEDEFASPPASSSSLPAPADAVAVETNPFRKTALSSELTFDEAMEAGDFERVTKLALEDPSLRTLTTCDRLEALSHDSSEYPPVLQYFEELVVESTLTAEETQFYLRFLLKQEGGEGGLQVFAVAVKQGRVTPTEELGDLLLAQGSPLLVNSAVVVFQRVGATAKVIKALQANFLYSHIVGYIQKMRLREEIPFDVGLLSSLAAVDPSLATEYALLLTVRRGVVTSEILEQVMAVFQERGLLQNLTAVLLEALVDDREEHAALQTRVIELNLTYAPAVGLAILEQKGLTHYDKRRIAELCRGLGFFQQAIDSYILLADWESIEGSLVMYSLSLEPEFVVNCCVYILGNMGTAGLLPVLRGLLAKRSYFHSALVLRVVTSLRDYLDPRAIITVLEESGQEELLLAFLAFLGPTFDTSKSHLTRVLSLGLSLAAVAPLYTFFRPLLLEDSSDSDPKTRRNLADCVDVALLKDMLILNCFQSQEEQDQGQNRLSHFPAVPPSAGRGLEEEQFGALFRVVNQHGFQEELVVRLMSTPSLLHTYLHTLETPEVALRVLLFLRAPENQVAAFLALFQDSPSAADYTRLVEEDRAHREMIESLGLTGKALVDHLLFEGNHHLRDLALFLLRAQDPDLWEHATTATKGEELLRVISEDQVLLLSFSTAEFSVLLKFLMKTESQNLEGLISLLHRVLVGIANHPFRLHRSLQTLLLASVLKSTTPGRVVTYLRSLNAFDAKDICSTAIRLGRFEEALQIAKHARDQELAVHILVNHLDDMARAFDFANTVDTPEVWKLVGLAQWRKNQMASSS